MCVCMSVCVCGGVVNTTADIRGKMNLYYSPQLHPQTQFPFGRGGLESGSSFFICSPPPLLKS